MLSDLMLNAMLGGLGAALAAGPLGCFVVWRRMAYFGDAAAHSALLGVALGLALGLPSMLGVLAVTLAMAAAVALLTMRGRVTPDAMLGVFAHAALALGLVALSRLENARVDLMGYLFGDILAVGPSDLWLIWIGAALILALLVWRWSALLNATLSPELARAEGGAPEIEQFALTMAIALVIAIAMQVVGLLLITALLILPASAARPLARSPEAMAGLAAGMGGLGVIAGLAGSYQWDAPSGPSIVVAVFLLFGLSTLLSTVTLRRAPITPRRS